MSLVSSSQGEPGTSWLPHTWSSAGSKASVGSRGIGALDTASPFNSQGVNGLNGFCGGGGGGTTVGDSIRYGMGGSGGGGNGAAANPSITASAGTANTGGGGGGGAGAWAAANGGSGYMTIKYWSAL